MTFYKKLQVFLILFSLLPFLYCTYINRTAHYAVWPIKTVWHEITYFDTAYVHESKDKDVVHTYASAAEAYEKGVEYLEEDSVDYAIGAFKQAVNIDKKFIEAHHQMGLAYLEKNTIYYRRKAVKSLREALFWERDNFKVQLDLGKAYLMQRFRYNARKKFTWLKKTNPDNIELLLSLGKLYKEDVEYYQNMVDVFTDDSGVLSFVDQDLLSAIFTYDGPRQVKEFLRDRDEFDSKFQDFSSYLKKDFANAAVAFTQVLGIDPKNREALYELSLLAFTAGMFGGFVKYQEKILEIDPNDKDV
ncbi:hypothetical protein KAS50_01465, partial [bacterium]|nr:hypothetical protein [bacterium]